MAIAGILMAFFAHSQKKMDWKFVVSAPPMIYLAALALAFNFYGFMNCIELTTASNSQVMIQMGPFILAVSGLLFFKESPNKWQIIGFILAALGFVFFYRDQLLISWSHKERYFEGNLWVIGASVTWAFYTIIQKQYSKNINPQKILLIVFFVSTLVLIPIANFRDFLNFNAFQWVLMIVLGLNSWLAYGSLGEALKLAPASHVSLIITLNPLLTIFLIQMLNKWDLLFIAYEPMNPMSYVGAGFVVTGVALTILSQRRNIKPKSIA